jgi:hypothetical protein
MKKKVKLLLAIDLLVFFLFVAGLKEEDIWRGEGDFFHSLYPFRFVSLFTSLSIFISNEPFF